MRIDIKQHKISLGDKFDIFTNDVPSHTVSAGLLKLLPSFKLYKTGISDPWLTVNKRWTFFLSSYDIRMHDGNVSAFLSKSFWKPSYQCRVWADLYEVFGHLGRKYSVYKNGIQVAWWDKNVVSVFNGNEYNVKADFDCNAELIIAFCIIMHYETGDDSDATVSIDFGNIGLVARKFDETWMPRNS